MFNIGLLAYSEGGEAIAAQLPTSTFVACFLGTPRILDISALEQTRTPISIALADEDDNLTVNTASDHMDIENHLRRSAYPYQISIYSHVHIGFAQRRLMQSKAEVFAKQGAFTQAVSFMREHMGTVNP